MSYDLFLQDVLDSGNRSRGHSLQGSTLIFADTISSSKELLRLWRGRTRTHFLDRLLSRTSARAFGSPVGFLRCMPEVSKLAMTHEHVCRFFSSWRPNSPNRGGFRHSAHLIPGMPEPSFPPPHHHIPSPTTNRSHIVANCDALHSWHGSPGI